MVLYFTRHDLSPLPLPPGPALSSLPGERLWLGPAGRHSPGSAWFLSMLVDILLCPHNLFPVWFPPAPPPSHEPTLVQEMFICVSLSQIIRHPTCSTTCINISSFIYSLKLITTIFFVQLNCSSNLTFSLLLLFLHSQWYFAVLPLLDFLGLNWEKIIDLHEHPPPLPVFLCENH